MPINIKNPEAVRAARELMELTGETITEAVTKAIRERIERERTRRRHQRLTPDLLRIRERFRALPVLDDRTADDIIGYCDRGLPGG